MSITLQQALIGRLFKRVSNLFQSFSCNLKKKTCPASIKKFNFNSFKLHVFFFFLNFILVDFDFFAVFVFLNKNKKIFVFEIIYVSFLI